MPRPRSRILTPESPGPVGEPVQLVRQGSSAVKLGHLKMNIKELQQKMTDFLIKSESIFTEVPGIWLNLHVLSSKKHTGKQAASPL